MAVVKLTYQQEELIHSAARKCGLDNFEVDANIGTFKGDNYLGVITTVTVKEKNNDKILHFLLKSAHTNVNFRKEAPIARVFAREAYLYNTILPRLFKLQSERSIADPFQGAARFYGSSLEDTNESILMEDLKKKNYRLWNRKIPMNDEHLSLVFAEYARFHAASLAFKHLHREEFNQLTEDIQMDVFVDGETLNPEVMEAYANINFKSGFAGVEGNVKATAALERLRENILTLFSYKPDEEDKSKQVILHGDCWCNNILFHYEDNSTTPTKVCFIDWQLSKLGSPVQDLSYFFSVCSGKEVIHQLPKYLQSYHKILANNLEAFGCDPEEVFSFDTLMKQWKKYSWYGVFMAMMILKIMLSESAEVPDMVEALDKGQNIMEAFQYDISKSSEYNNRLCDLVEFMVDNNYL